MFLFYNFAQVIFRKRVLLNYSKLISVCNLDCVTAPGMPRLPNQAFLPGGLKAKHRHQPKYRLPALNWSVLRPNQIVGTIFNELDDDAVLNQVITSTDWILR